MEIPQRKTRSVAGKVDLTPMVDLGFLLITFFMLATTFTKPKTMEVFKPIGEDESPVPESKSATVLLGGNDKMYTYVLPDRMESPADIKMDSLDYGPQGLRKYIQRRQNEVQAMWGDKDKLVVIIKPLPHTSMKNVVDVLDEMLINGVKRYAIVKANSPIDSMIVAMIGEQWK